jgi:antitoxin component of MazEF toxin-antitoxin module
MENKLIEYGKDVALILNKAILKDLNISMNTSFEISNDGQNIIISPKPDGKNDHVKNDHFKELTSLAKWEEDL